MKIHNAEIGKDLKIGKQDGEVAFTLGFDTMSMEGASGERATLETLAVETDKFFDLYIEGGAGVAVIEGAEAYQIMLQKGGRLYVPIHGPRLGCDLNALADLQGDGACTLELVPREQPVGGAVRDELAGMRAKKVRHHGNGAEIVGQALREAADAINAGAIGPDVRATVRPAV